MENNTVHPTSLRVSNIQPGANPRRFFDPVFMAELEDSIRAQGVNQPVLVRPLTDGSYQLVAGERRVRAATAVFGGDYEIPVLVKELSDESVTAAALSENINRQAMTPVEEAEGAAKMLAQCQGNRAEAAKRMGWSLTTLDRRLALMYASDKVRAALQERKIDLGHAELLAACRKEAQDAAIDWLLAAEKLMSVADLKSFINRNALLLDTAIFDKTECAGCHHNSGNQTALFAEVISGGRCTNKECFDRKTEEQLEVQVKTLSDEYQQVRIVRPGENFTVTPLRADGPKGVGVEQAQACRVCKSYGAVVSGLPDKLGAVFKSVCMDVPCNQKMVAARVAAETEASASTKPPAPPAPGKPGAAAASEGSMPDAQAPTSVAKAKQAGPAAYPEPSNRVQEYREKVWRLIFERVVLKLDPVSNRSVLLALCLKSPGQIDSHALGEAIKDITSKSSTVSLGEMVKAIRSIEQGQLAGALQTIPSKVKSGQMGLPLTDVVSVLKEFQVQIADHWKVGQPFLELLTKNEIDAVCREIGVSKAMGDGYAKACNQSKSDYIKAVLSVENFDLTGRIPKLMAW